MLKCKWIWENSSLKKNIPFNTTQIKAIIKILEKNLDNSDEWKNVSKIISHKPLFFNLFVCEEKTIRDYQIKYKKIKRSTDVLSFPSIESPQNQEKGFIGDVVLSVENVKRNAIRYHVSYREEFLRVFIHALLHLLGMDHVGVSRKKAQRMKFVQESLLKKCRPML
jgi:probable rRNA maturation factor